MVVLFASFQVSAQNTKTNAQQEVVNNIKTVKFKITGITCAGCSNTIYKTLKQVDGVIEHSVEYPGDVAIIEYDSSKTNVKALEEVIEKKGYKVELIEDKV